MKLKLCDHEISQTTYCCSKLKTSTNLVTCAECFLATLAESEMAAPSARNARIQLAQQLPPVLTRFFQRYPPARFSAAASLPPTSTLSAESSAPSQAPPDAPADSSATRSHAPSWDPAPPSPFQTWKHPVTGLWQGPAYSLRRQAELVNTARAHGVEELLPYTVKGSGIRAMKRFEEGLRVRGTGVGRKVKGHWDERTLQTKLETRRKAMLRMPRLVMKWREVRLRGSAVWERTNSWIGGAWTLVEEQAVEEKVMHTSSMRTRTL